MPDLRSSHVVGPRHQLQVVDCPKSSVNGEAARAGVTGLRRFFLVRMHIATDGTLIGPNFPALERILENTRCQIISSGGVANLEQIKQLAEMPRLYGLIIGRALFDGTIDLGEAVALANYHSDARGAV